MKVIKLPAASLLVTALAWTSFIFGADYPTKPVRIIVPFASGGAADLAARVIAEKLSPGLGQPVLVESKTGGGTVIATEYVAKSASDGQVILLQSTSIVLLPAFYKNLPFDVQKSLAPIQKILTSPLIVFSSPMAPYNSFGEFLAYAKRNPGAQYGTSGVGGAPHLAMELLQAAVGIKLDHIPYKGGAESVTAVLRGEVPSISSAPFPGVNYLKDGKIRALAVMNARRSSLLPLVPTISEQGVPGFEASFWNALFVPGGTPGDVVSKLNREISAVLLLRDVDEKIKSQGAEIFKNGTPEELRIVVANELSKWGKLISEKNIQAQ